MARASVLVVDASPLILLTRIDRLALLPSLTDRVDIPEAVLHELEAGAHRDAAAASVRAMAGFHIVADVPIPASVARWDLGAGESQVLAQALGQLETWAVVDDRAARRCAEVLGVPVRGTLAIITLARQAGHLDELAPVLKPCGSKACVSRTNSSRWPSIVSERVRVPETIETGAPSRQGDTGLRRVGGML